MAGFIDDPAVLADEDKELLAEGDVHSMSRTRDA
jgi:hypothetical protein